MGAANFHYSLPATVLRARVAGPRRPRLFPWRLLKGILEALQ